MQLYSQYCNGFFEIFSNGKTYEIKEIIYLKNGKEYLKSSRYLPSKISWLNFDKLEENKQFYEYQEVPLRRKINLKDKCFFMSNGRVWNTLSATLYVNLDNLVYNEIEEVRERKGFDELYKILNIDVSYMKEDGDIITELLPFEFYISEKRNEKGQRADVIFSELYKLIVKNVDWKVKEISDDKNSFEISRDDILNNLEDFEKLFYEYR